ncbi:MAG: hypothetical protein GF349_04605 [Candidatus Magasanikbacteria bacterium]|nr:hypothetical protein [Candidatus Magasanikbacteria bacterium]
MSVQELLDFFKMIRKNKKNKIFRREFRSKKDFAWQKSKRNPFVKKSKLSLLQKLEYLFLSLALFIMAAIFLYHPYFQISDISVDGIKRIDKLEFREAVKGAMDYKRYFILPAKAYVMTDTTELKNLLKSKYALSDINVEKKFPHYLKITVEEQLSTIIYDNGDRYSYLGKDGTIVEVLRETGEDEWIIKTKIVTSTNENGEIISEEVEESRTHIPPVHAIINEIGDYPIIYDKRHKKGEVNDVMLSEQSTMGILSWFNNIKKIDSLPRGYFLLENELGDSKYITENGWFLKINIADNSKEKLNKLLILLDDQINLDRISYVDLRFDGRIYWK